jgi:hypothetical protein
MRTLLHFGIFALVLTTVGQASADDHRRRQRQTTIVIAPQTRDRAVRPVRAPAPPPPRVYDEQRYRHHRSRGLVEARREVIDQRRDHDQILHMSLRWEQATANRNPHAQRNVERRINAWIEREIDESSHKADHGRYVHRLHQLRRELRGPRGWYGYGYGRGRHHVNRHKANVIGEVVQLSERQLRHAQARARRHTGLAFAYR